MASSAPTTAPPVAIPTLEDRYAVDSDGNLVPDFVESELGYDPNTDDCAAAVNCPGVDELGDLPLLTDQNVLLVLDSSGSMAGTDGGGTVKIDAARAALERYVVGTPDTFELGLMVYGHKGNNEPEGRDVSCDGIEVFAPLGELDVDSVDDTLQQFEPTGWTPLAESLDRAAEVFAGREGDANRIVMVTDGVETCDGDAVAAARRLARSDIGVVVDVVGFDIDDTAQERALERVAEITGGTYTTADDAGALIDYFDSLVRRQVTLVNALGCLLVNTTRVEVCSLRLESDAERYLVREAIDTGDADRSALLQDLSNRMSARTTAYREQLRTDIEGTVRELERALEDAQRRYQRRYDEQLSWSTCTAVAALYAEVTG